MRGGRLRGSGQATRPVDHHPLEGRRGAGDDDVPPRLGAFAARSAHDDPRGLRGLRDLPVVGRLRVHQAHPHQVGPSPPPSPGAGRPPNSTASPRPRPSREGPPGARRASARRGSAARGRSGPPRRPARRRGRRDRRACRRCRGAGPRRHRCSPSPSSTPCVSKRLAVQCDSCSSTAEPGRTDWRVNRNTQEPHHGHNTS